MGARRGEGGSTVRHAETRAPPVRAVGSHGPSRSRPSPSQSVASFSEEEEVSCVDLVMDDHLVLTTHSPPTLQLWQLRTLKRIRCLQGPSSTRFFCCLLPPAHGSRQRGAKEAPSLPLTEHRVLSVDKREAHGQMRLWHVGSATVTCKICFHARRVLGASLCEANGRVASIDEGGVCVLWTIDGDLPCPIARLSAAAPFESVALQVVRAAWGWGWGVSEERRVGLGREHECWGWA